VHRQIHSPYDIAISCPPARNSNSDSLQLVRKNEKPGM
jgi:hypothetical protein